MTTIQIDPLEMLRFADLKAFRIVNDRKTLKAWMNRKDDPFPPSHKLTERSICWRRRDVEQWLERRKQNGNGH